MPTKKYVVIGLLTMLCSLSLAGCLSQGDKGQAISFHPLDMGRKANVSCFEQEKNGGLWVGLDGNGLAYRESPNASFRFYNKLSGTLPSDVVLCMYRDHSDVLWFGTFGDGIFCWDGKDFKQPVNERLRDKGLEYVSAFWEDNDKRMWVASLRQGLYCCDSTGVVTVLNEENSPLATNCILGLESFDQTHVFIATGWGLFVLDTKNRQVRPVTDSKGIVLLERQLVRSLYAASDSMLWIGTQTGLYVYNSTNGHCEHLTTDDGLADNYVKAISADKSGDIWATSEHHVTHIKKTLEDNKTWHYKCEVLGKDQIPGNTVFHVRAIACTMDGRMLLGTSEGCLVATAGEGMASLKGPAFPWWLVVFAVIFLLLCLLLTAQLVWRHSVSPPVHQYSEIEPSETTVVPADEQFKEKAIHIVEENIANSEFSVEQLSEALGMSRGHLYKKLVAITGKPPLEFIRIIRVKKGRQLLEKSGENISQVAWSIGMSPKQFSKYFKEEYGMLPSDFVKRK